MTAKVAAGVHVPGPPPRWPSPELPAGQTGGTGALRRRAGQAGFLLLLGLLVWCLWPVRFLGATSYTIVSGHSMEPRYHTGDLAVSRSTDDIEPGDVIVYHVPAGEPGEGKNVIHRVVSGDGTQGYTTKGDNSANPDIWHPTSKDVVGKVITMLPRGGTLLRWLFSPISFAAVASGFLVWALWPRNGEVPSGETHSGEAPPVDADGGADPKEGSPTLSAPQRC